MYQVRDDDSWYHCGYCGRDVYGDPDDPCEGDCDDYDLDEDVDSDRE